MNNTPSNQTNHSEEIDLGYLFRKLSDFFKKCVKLLFLVITFFKRYAIITLVLLLIGIGYGYYKDKKVKKVYANEIIVIPNFESTDYLYDKVNSFNSKIALNDTVFLKKVFGGNYYKIRKVDIEPIVDIYNFVSKSKENVDVFRIIAQGQDMSDYIEDLTNSKYYKYHRMNINILGRESSEKIVEDLVKHLNDNRHYLEYQEIGRANTRFQIEQHQLMIAQIDSILKMVGSSNDKPASQSVFINDNSQLNDVLTTKRELLQDLLLLKKKESDEVEIIKLVNGNYNVISKEGFRISNKVKYPLLLVLIFSGFFFVGYSYKKLKEIAES